MRTVYKRHGNVYAGFLQKPTFGDVGEGGAVFRQNELPSRLKSLVYFGQVPWETACFEQFSLVQPDFTDNSRTLIEKVLLSQCLEGSNRLVIYSATLLRAIEPKRRSV
jgi:hypothetical protein